MVYINLKTKTKLVGLSLSFCIRDILAGRVKAEDVECIITATACSNIYDIIDDYSQDYWAGYEKSDIINLLKQLEDRIIQPRLYYPHFLICIPDGCWLNKE